MISYPTTPIETLNQHSDDPIAWFVLMKFGNVQYTQPEFLPISKLWSICLPLEDLDVIVRTADATFWEHVLSSKIKGSYKWTQSW